MGFPLRIRGKVGYEEGQARQGRGGDLGEICSIIPLFPPYLLLSCSSVTERWSLSVAEMSRSAASLLLCSPVTERWSLSVAEMSRSAASLLPHSSLPLQVFSQT